MNQRKTVRRGGKSSRYSSFKKSLRSRKIKARRFANRSLRKARKMMGSVKRSLKKAYLKKRRKVKKSLNSWNKKVALMYKSLKKKKPNATLADAMKAASKEKSKSKSKGRPLSISVD